MSDESRKAFDTYKAWQASRQHMLDVLESEGMGDALAHKNAEIINLKKQNTILREGLEQISERNCYESCDLTAQQKLNEAEALSAIRQELEKEK